VFQRGLDLNVDILFLLKYFSLRRISFGRGEPPLCTLSNFSPTADRRSKVSPAAHLLRRAAAQIFRRRQTRATGGCRISTGGVRRIRRPGGNTDIIPIAILMTYIYVIKYNY
jgi:hypothetical protein